MYCSKCGEADQNDNVYCRKCGSFRLDSLKTDMTVLLIGNFILFACCLSYLFFLILLSIYRYIEGLPPLNLGISDAFIFIPFISFMFNNILFFVRAMRKMNKNSDDVPEISEKKQTELSEQLNVELTNFETKDLLPPADFQSVIPSVVEETTRNLEKVRRK
jgi:hypothetical protein